MKKTFLKSVVATAVVAAAVALSSVAVFAATHTLTADSDGVADGDTFDNGYFTAVGAGAYKASNKVDTFELGKKGANYIKFTPEGNATVKVSIASTSSSNTSYVDLCNDSITSLGQKSVVGTTPTEVTFDTQLEAGKTYIIANLGTDKATRLASVVVEETGSASYPNFEVADTDTVLDAGKSDTAALDANITGLAAGDTTGTVEAPYDTETIPGFTLYGNVATTTDSDGNEVQSFSGMTVEGNSKSFEGVTYANRLKTNGNGSTNACCIVVELDSDSTIEAIGMSGNSSSTRPFVIATGDGTVLASHDFVGSTMSRATFSVTAGKYYMYADTATAGTNGGVNLYSLKVYSGVTYKLPVVELENTGVTNGSVYLTAKVNGDFTSGEVTGIGFILAKPNDTATQEKSCINYTIDADGNFIFIGKVAEQNLKAQAYVDFTSEVDGSTVRRCSNTVVNIVAS